MNLTIQTFENILSIPLCEDIIERFEDSNNDDNNDVSLTKVIPKEAEGWKKIEHKLYLELLKQLFLYKSVLLTSINNIENNKMISLLSNDIYLYDFRVEKYVPSNNTQSEQNRNRENNRHNVITFIYFLNNISTGGEIVVNDVKINSKQGTLLLFPDDYNARYNPPCSNCQYTVTGQLFTHHK